jgi:low temperature requirement protein LtrA
MAERVAHLRPQDERAAEVGPVELFFDLVYVLAVTQLTRHLLANLTLPGALETTILLLALATAVVVATPGWSSLAAAVARP